MGVPGRFLGGSGESLGVPGSPLDVPRAPEGPPGRPRGPPGGFDWGHGRFQKYVKNVGFYCISRYVADLSDMRETLEGALGKEWIPRGWGDGVGGREGWGGVAGGGGG